MAKIVIACWLLALGTVKLSAQDLGTIWKEAASRAREQDWNFVKSTLRPHLLPLPQDSLAPWMHQLYGIACEKTGDRASALISAENILDLFPNWAHRSEAILLAGKMEIRMGHFSKAWQYFSQLPPKYAEELKTILANEKAIPTDSLEKLKPSESIASNEITGAFFGSKSQTEGKSDKKPEVPKIGVVLPFNYKSMKKEKTENPVLDFYRGVLLASEFLAALDSAVELHCFDTENKDEVFSKIGTGKVLNGLQVVFGPLKSNHLDIWSKSKKSKQIPLINPLSNYVPELADACFFTQQASFSTLAQESFTFLSRLSTGKKAGIVYGPERNDSILAVAYSNYLKKMGRQVVLFKKVGKNSAANLTKFLVEAGLDSTDHLFVPNNEPLVRVQLLSAYSWIKGKFPILVVGKWLEAGNADYEELARYPIYFLNPDLPDRQNPNWRDWERNYFAKWGKPPGWVAWKGFDLTVTFARSWYASGGDWCRNWKSGKPIPSPLFGSYRFSSLRPDNQFLPIYSVVPEGLNRVWPE